MKKLSILISVIIFPGLLMAQEVLQGISLDSRLAEKASQRAELKRAEQEEAIMLPFFDDFDQEEITPSPDRWTDAEVLVNKQYQYFPVNKGVATLDVLNDSGYIHQDASFFSFEADELTSRPIRLDSVFEPQKRAITKADSIYLSFYFQPGGRGNQPEPADSLVLEFLSIDETDTTYIPPDTVINGNDTTVNPADTIINEAWRWAWSSPGMSMDSIHAKTGRYFQQVMVPITDSTHFYKNGFRFRFKNYATLANNTLPNWQSNVDHWNIDFVHLDIERSMGDTVYKDISFVNRAPSMLENLYSMPYHQYKFDYVNPLNDTLDIFITNLDTTAYNGQYYYKVFNNGNTVHTNDGGNFTIAPFDQSGYVSHQPFAHPLVNFIFPVSNLDSATFTIQHVVKSDSTLGGVVLGDTMTYDQTFSNYYAYDDGTPEAGYGLTPAGSQLAYQFKVKGPDTLRAIQIAFNRTRNEANKDYFILKVWNSVRGMPGDVIYAREGQQVEYGEGFGGFHTYYIDDKVVSLRKDETFFIGMEQVSNDNLNIGYDRSNDVGDKVFYNTTGQWNSSIYSGAIMMRPVLGKQLVKYDLPQKNEPTGSIKLYPNPLKSGTLYVDLPEDFDPENKHRLGMQIFDTYGRPVYQGDFHHELNMERHKEGIYVVRVVDPVTGKKYTQKLIIMQ
ncbi:MAG: T9SS type A sorting domain-containing protein [Bacteroidales bacterium]|nr:T9SS type A sorting domain-containing protein [Bacteroidales bacterium]